MEFENPKDALQKLVKPDSIVWSKSHHNFLSERIRIKGLLVPLIGEILVLVEMEKENK
jgi:hypothetical protein